MRPHCRTGTKPLPPETPHCPDEKGLQVLAAGIAPLGFMEDHGGHIANCDRCALLLKNYLALFSEELTEEERRFLAELETSKPEGQKNLLQKILQQVRGAREEKKAKNGFLV